MLKITLKDGSVRELAAPQTIADFTKDLSMGLYRNACCALVDGKVADLCDLLDHDCAVEILTFDSEQGQRAFNHTASHILAQAVQHLFPEAKLAIGPAIEDGFYYDFDVPTPFTPEDLEKLEAEGKNVFSGEDAFRLYDTFGFPIDLTRELCEERGITVDEEGYKTLMEKQRTTAREATARNVGDVAWVEDVLKGVEGGEDFVGYDSLSVKTEILGIVYEGERVEALGEGDTAQLVLARTPFYAEMGGQVGDSGTITCGENVFTVTDTRKSGSGHFIHVGTVTHGTFQMGDTVTATVDERRRMDIMRNHTACHLLQKALQEVLGDHVHQAGSMVDDKVCRFDFSHFSAVTPEELEKVEARVNELILEANPVTTTEMSIEEAKKLGAMALFGEKYGDTVRVVNANNKSIELCGGTHADNTAKLGLFKIVSESSVAAGIRRITAVTGFGVLKHIENDERIMQSAAAAMKLGNVAELDKRAATLAAEVKAKDRELAELRSICDRVLIICEGRVAGELKPEASDEEYGLMMSSAHVSKEKEA